MIPPKNIRLHWDAEKGWLLDVPWGVSESMLRRVAEYAVPRQIDRWKSLPPGDKKEDLKLAIQKLQRFEIKQNIVGPRGDGLGDLVLFSGSKE
jgi:hypothetical protein